MDPFGLAAANYWGRVTENFIATNESIPTMGILLPTGLGLLTAGVTAQYTGGITFLGAFSFYGSSQFGGALALAGLNSTINTAAVGGALQFGNLVGSMVSAVPISSHETVRDWISDLISNTWGP